jgi:hypothetical protein
MKNCYLIAFSMLALLCTPVAAMAQEEAADPIGELALNMEEVVIDLSGMTTGEPVQGNQKEIVSKLDKLIAELEKECEQCRGGAKGPNPSRPMVDSNIKGGPGGMGDLHAARKNGKQWAELPPHERERIVQSMTEGFPAHYQKILERYYKRLAEENTASSAANGDKSSDDGDKPSETKKEQPAKGAQPKAKNAARETSTKGSAKAAKST